MGVSYTCVHSFRPRKKSKEQVSAKAWTIGERDGANLRGLGEGARPTRPVMVRNMAHDPKTTDIPATIELFRAGIGAVTIHCYQRSFNDRIRLEQINLVKK